MLDYISSLLPSFFTGTTAEGSETMPSVEKPVKECPDSETTSLISIDSDMENDTEPTLIKKDEKRSTATQTRSDSVEQTNADNEKIQLKKERRNKRRQRKTRIEQKKQEIINQNKSFKPKITRINQPRPGF